ncbi:hypothetical protein BD309DRAFT_208249 [Dichomitus squalens]|nr:hypothetical protein BD309DRAFT_208249 [Dichomitus squalens]
MVPLLLFYLLCGVTWKLQMSVHGRTICRLKLQGQRRLGGVSACRRTSSISRLPSSYVSVLRLPRRNCHRNRIQRRCSDVGEVRYCVPSLKIPARVSSMDRVRGRLPLEHCAISQRGYLALVAVGGWIALIPCPSQGRTVRIHMLSCWQMLISLARHERRITYMVCL